MVSSVEKVHVVWAPTSNTRRFLSPVYILCVITVSLYAVVAVIQFIGMSRYPRILDYLMSCRRACALSQG